MKWLWLPELNSKMQKRITVQQQLTHEKRQCLSTQIINMKRIQVLLSFKLCGQVKLFEDLLHISWKRVNACYQTFSKMKNAKEIISGILYEKSNMHTCIDAHKSFGYFSHCLDCMLQKIQQTDNRISDNGCSLNALPRWDIENCCLKAIFGMLLHEGCKTLHKNLTFEKSK